MADKEVLSNELDFFSHKDEFFALIGELTAATTPSKERGEELVDALAEILDKYQEQPLLLDRYLEATVTPLMHAVRGMLKEWEESKAAGAAADAEGDAKNDEGTFPLQVFHNEHLHLVMKVVYLVCKTRGYKHVVKLFPHEVSDLEPALQLLLAQDRTEHDTWETRYVLLLWLSILVIIPFDLSTVDSTLTTVTTTDNASATAGASSLIDSIISTARTYLSDPGAVRDGAAVCLSRLLTRPDMDASHLRHFIQWSNSVLTDPVKRTNVFLTTGVFTALTMIAKHGHRTVLREVLPLVFTAIVELSGVSTASPLLRKLTVKLAQRVGLTYLPPRVVGWRYQRGQRSLLDNLATTGVEVDAAAAGGKAAEDGKHGDNESDEEEQDALDVPEQIEDIIEMLLTGLRDKDTVVRWSAAKGVGRITGRLPYDFADDVVEAVLSLLRPEEGDGAWHGGCLALAELARRGLLVPARLPSVVPVITKALVYDVRRGLHSVGAHVRDAACYVCWAFARAYAPAVMHPHVHALAAGMLTVSVFDREINCRRAASAAFQESVGRQGHENFPHGITILTAADYFTLGNRTNAYLTVAPVVAQFKAYRGDLFQHLSEVKLRHWDVDIRILSSKGLAALTKTDPEYVATELMSKLLPLALHRELVTRHGATMGIAECVLALSKLEQALPAETLTLLRNLVPKIEKQRLYRGRGGEYMRAAVCRLIECMADAGLEMSRKLVLRLMDTLDDCLKHPHDTIQDAAVAAFRALARQHMNVEDAQLLTRVPHKHSALVIKCDIPSTRRGSALALGALPAGMLAATPTECQKVLDALIKGSTVEKKADARDAETRRNAVIAMAQFAETMGVQATAGAAGLSLVQCHMIVEALLAATRDFSTDKRGDVGSWVRQHAMLSLEKMVVLLSKAEAAQSGSQADGSAETGEEFTLSSPQDRKQFLVQDPEAAVDAVVAGGIATVADAPMALPLSLTTHLIGCLLREASSKLDLLRQVAGDIITRLMHAPNGLVKLPHHDSLAAIFEPHDGTIGADGANGAGAAAAGAGAEEKKADEDEVPAADDEEPVVVTKHAINWAAPTQCYPRIMKLLAMPEYVADVVEGLVTSVGGMSESVVKHSSSAFLEWATEQMHKGNWRTLTKLVKSLEALMKPHVPRDNSAASVAARSTADATTGAGAGAGAGNAVGGAAADTAAKADTGKPKKKGKISTRLIVPTLRTLNILLANGILDGLHTRSEFAKELLQVVESRVLKTTNINRLLAGVDIFVAMAGFSGPVGTRCLQLLLELLAHAFPKVRKACAEKVYVKLLTIEDQLGDDVDVDDALEILTETSWETEVAELTPKRDELYEVLHLAVPADRDVLLAAANKAAGTKKKTDTFDSYSALVSEMHY